MASTCASRPLLSTVLLLRRSARSYRTQTSSSTSWKPAATPPRLLLALFLPTKEQPSSIPMHSGMTNLYGQAPSRQAGAAILTMFVCAARELEPTASIQSPAADSGPWEDQFRVSVLERHPFTTQTFVPLTADPSRRYLVIVAPSLPPTPVDQCFPVPSSSQPPGGWLPGRGLPDWSRLRAFVATAEQAVTYGAGTWHAPMVALGEPGTAVTFVVAQFANRVAIEDCQEVFLSSSASSSVTVTLPPSLG